MEERTAIHVPGKIPELADLNASEFNQEFAAKLKAVYDEQIARSFGPGQMIHGEDQEKQYNKLMRTLITTNMLMLAHPEMGHLLEEVHVKDLSKDTGKMVIRRKYEAVHTCQRHGC